MTVATWLAVGEAVWGDRAVRLDHPGTPFACGDAGLGVSLGLASRVGHPPVPTHRAATAAAKETPLSTK